jgi:KipI family sensor histidine kinase inhibitor
MDARVTRLGDGALLVAFEPVIDEAINARVLALATQIRQRGIPGVFDVVPAYSSCAVHFDPLQTRLSELEAAIHEAIRAGRKPVPPAQGGASTIQIPVCYGGPFGPDLPAVAEWARCSESDVIERHSRREYRVYMIGFLPGFPYLGVVDSTIAVPRLAHPRTRVPAGSVGIAGVQTGVYPVDAPGGWQLIGRTPLRLFDPSWPVPSRLTPGDRVRFVAITADDYDRYSSSP